MRQVFLVGFLLGVTIYSMGQDSSTSQNVIAQGPSDVTNQLLSKSLNSFAGGKTLTDVRLEGKVFHIPASSTEESGTVVLDASASGQSKASFNFASVQRIEEQNGYDEAPSCSWSINGVKTPAPDHNCAGLGSWFMPTLVLRQLFSLMRRAWNYQKEFTLLP